MTDLRTNLALAFQALGTQRLRAFLTILGLTMGVATLMAVITLILGANTFVADKVANLGTGVSESPKRLLPQPIGRRTSAPAAGSMIIWPGWGRITSTVARISGHSVEYLPGSGTCRSYRHGRHKAAV